MTFSEQEQPVVFQAGGGPQRLKLAGRYTSGVYANPYTVADAQVHRLELREAAKRTGRVPRTR
ncbi:hypothetical protein ACFFLM_00510 [Deinococcus oregonensis]|uniref:Uncharacterized protein n=1 Tax=Deinococcus oregonensis TaxID=1805970 RepID=A0ABV6ASK7_9DEIO